MGHGALALSGYFYREADAYRFCLGQSGGTNGFILRCNRYRRGGVGSANIKAAITGLETDQISANRSDRHHQGDPSNLDLKAWVAALSAVPTGAMTEELILHWIEGPLRRFFPFQRFLGGYGRLSGGRIQMRKLVTSGHEAAFLASPRKRIRPRVHGAASPGGCEEIGRPSSSTPQVRLLSPPVANSTRSESSRSASSPRMASSTPSPTPGPISASPALPLTIRTARGRRSI